MESYAADPRIDAILYLVPDRPLGRRIEQAARTAGIGELVHVQALAGPPQGAPDHRRTLGRRPQLRASQLGDRGPAPHGRAPRGRAHTAGRRARGCSMSRSRGDSPPPAKPALAGGCPVLLLALLALSPPALLGVGALLPRDGP